MGKPLERSVVVLIEVFNVGGVEGGVEDEEEVGDDHEEDGGCERGYHYEERLCHPDFGAG